MVSGDEPRYWFPAKRYGWGWGAPTVWQGWAVMIGWIAGLLLGSLWLLPRGPVAFLAFTAVMVAILIAVCYAKGAPPRWRWGDDER